MVEWGKGGQTGDTITLSLVLYLPLNFLCLSFKTIQIIILISNALRDCTRLQNLCSMYLKCVFIQNILTTTPTKSFHPIGYLKRRADSY
jgi:hypothetical protein